MVVAARPDTPCLEPLQLPLQLAQEVRLSPEQFELVCQANPDVVLELSADGHLIAMTPAGSETSARNSTLVVLLGLALRASGLPFKESLNKQLFTGNIHLILAGETVVNSVWS
jgi:Uma2 family endonuclease